MNAFNKRAARRIAAISLLVAVVTSPVIWFISREIAEEEMVALAMEESRHILAHIESFARPDDERLIRQAGEAARTITGGLFDIAEIYDASGRKLAESTTPAGEAIERLLPKHGRPQYTEASYESLDLTEHGWVLRIFVPLTPLPGATSAAPSGYFEGVRLVPEWQQAQLMQGAFLMALIAAGASLLCGLTIYPFVVQLSADNIRKANELLDSHLSMMEALGRAVARRDSDTGAHNYRVAWIAARIGESLDLPVRSMQALIIGSFLHDIGKIGIPDAILLKPGRLDDEEMTIMRTHVDQGEAIVTGIAWLEEAAEIVSGHHEKWDGSGYPRGLRGSDIPLGARIFAVADVFDALTSKRPYKAPMDFPQAIAIIQRDSGSHFDPDITRAFLAIAGELHATLSSCSEADCRRLLNDKLKEHFFPGN
ncbi:metal-dependent phosphohydrolase [Azonexus hydrophilus]|uniref:Metal-dependent phosphohydrolase n=1 Tax=Azonexus hydrophilus TaxID=418702 RepID=A0A1R1I5H0_9RHOO|nr:HD-GYP domain-containing protein [Azonexus hydrophilus]OMG53884.1 metal-dependent phosphohydrolase [Azonexus hydrophilus]